MGLIKYIKNEINIIKERDPAFRSNAEIFLYPSFKAIYKYRIAHWFYVRGHYYIARRISQKAARKTGIEIHPGAKIGKGLFIDHGHGVVIGETCEIGNNVTIYQGVTLGGTGKEKGKRHPTIGDNVMISAGAKILGSFTVGSNSRIGAGSVVLSEVPEDSTVVGIPGRVVKRGDCRIIPSESLDQIHLPDPVKMELCRLEVEIDKLKKQINDMIKTNERND
ncbi:MAG: cysE [Clostridiales bacterium]|nr:cysE [Clostridiales bacterium]